MYTLLETNLLVVFNNHHIFIYKYTEQKTLDLFFRKLRGRRSVKFGTVIAYMEKECRMPIFKKIMPKISIINLN